MKHGWHEISSRIASGVSSLVHCVSPAAGSQKIQKSRFLTRFRSIIAKSVQTINGFAFPVQMSVNHEMCTDQIVFVESLRELKSEVIQAAKANYTRRGRPAEKTGWSPAMIHDYMRYQFYRYKHGKLSKEKLGGQAWGLPEKDAKTNKPADLPKEVRDWMATDKSRRKKRARSSPSQSRSSSIRSVKESHSLDSWIFFHTETSSAKVFFADKGFNAMTNVSFLAHFD